MLDAHVFPVHVELVGDDHGQAGLHTLPNFGILAHNRDDAIGNDADESAWRERYGRRRLRRLRERLRDRLDIVGEEHAAAGKRGDAEKAATIEERGFHGASWALARLAPRRWSGWAGSAGSVGGHCE